MPIYAWNLSSQVTEDFFRQTFGTFGRVSATIISSTSPKDRDNGQLRRFACVEMPDEAGAGAQAAIRNLNRRSILGRQMIIYGSSEN